MEERPPQVLAVIGSLHQNSHTRTVVMDVVESLRVQECPVDVLDFVQEPLPLFNPETAHQTPGFGELKGRVEKADVYLIATPDYHGCISSTTKNFLDHFWQEFAGKLFATIIASHEKGLTVTDQLRTLARQCYAWSIPYEVSFAEQVDVKEGKIVSERLRYRLEMLARDIRVYGGLLARQRRADLAGTDPGFMAKLRSG